MFKDIGNKIKSVASTVYSINLVITSLVAVGLFVSVFSRLSDDGDGLIGFFFGLFVGGIAFALGFLWSWLSVILLYGYGDLIAKTTDIHRMMAINGMGGSPIAPKTYAPPVTPVAPAPAPVSKYAPPAPAPTATMPSPVAPAPTATLNSPTVPASEPTATMPQPIINPSDYK